MARGERLVVAEGGALVAQRKLFLLRGAVSFLFVTRKPEFFSADTKAQEGYRKHTVDRLNPQPVQKQTLRWLR